MGTLSPVNHEGLYQGWLITQKWPFPRAKDAHCNICIDCISHHVLMLFIHSRSGASSCYNGKHWVEVSWHFTPSQSCRLYQSETTVMNHERQLQKNESENERKYYKLTKLKCFCCCCCFVFVFFLITLYQNSVIIYLQYEHILDFVKNCSWSKRNPIKNKSVVHC